MCEAEEKKMITKKKLVCFVCIAAVYERKKHVKQQSEKQKRMTDLKISTPFSLVFAHIEQLRSPFV